MSEQIFHLTDGYIGYSVEKAWKSFTVYLQFLWINKKELLIESWVLRKKDWCYISWVSASYLFA